MAAPDTVQSIDVALTDVRFRFLAAEERGDLDGAAKAYKRLDELLERRSHVPHPRSP